MSLLALESLSTVNWFLGLAVTAAVTTFLFQSRQAAVNSKNNIPLPPGPPARWFWDNALPSVNIARTLTDWVAEYGPVIALRQGSQIIVIIGRVDVTISVLFNVPCVLIAATEIMEKKGAALVDRPHSVVASEFLSNGLRPLLLRSGERLRRYRKAAHSHLQPKAIEAYQDMQLENAKNVITDVLNDPKNHRTHAQRFAASVILILTYGKSTPTSNDDPDFVRIRQVMENFEYAMRPGAFLVDRIPLLKYIPGHGRQVKQYYDFELQLYRDQMDRVRLDMESNKTGNSFMRMLLEHTDEHGLSRDEMAFLAGNLFGAAAETSAVAITNMILAAACYPEAQRRVQEELDMVVGNHRMPSWEHSDSLPQVHAFVFEALRWRPVTPIGFAHRATEDIVWKGQRIPAGASVIGCHLAISQDPMAFPEPEKFNPQRWIDNDGRLRNDMCSYPYGFGRRVCPGKHFANRSLYINLALLLWSFRIVERPDAPIDMNAYSDSVVAEAAPFDVEFIPRIQEGRLREMMSESMI